MSLTISKIRYAGWQNCLRLANSEIELIVTIDAGPRVIRCGFIGEQNEFAEYPDQTALIDDGKYHSYGGHRLWAAPETDGWTNHPDNQLVGYQENDGELFLKSVKEKGTQLQKQLQVRLDGHKNRVRVIHTITNHGSRTISLAPWAITVMAPGGRAIIPQEPFVPHGDRVLPVRPLVLWGYTRMQDTRWQWGDHFIQLRQDAQSETPQKIGAHISQGWIAYVNHGTMFLKKFSPYPDLPYPDFGCNAEIFTNKRMLEVESLGPLVSLRPEESTHHTESWYLFRGISVGTSDADIEKALGPLLEQTDSDQA